MLLPRQRFLVVPHRTVHFLSFIYSTCTPWRLSCRDWIVTSSSNAKTVKEQTFHKRSTNVPQTFHKRSTNVPQTFHKCSTNVPQTFHKRSTNVPQTFHKHSKNVPQTFQYLKGMKPKRLVPSQIRLTERDNFFLVQESRFWTKSKQSVLNTVRQIREQYQNILVSFQNNTRMCVHSFFYITNQ